MVEIILAKLINKFKIGKIFITFYINTILGYFLQMLCKGCRLSGCTIFLYIKLQSITLNCLKL